MSELRLTITVTSTNKSQYLSIYFQLKTHLASVHEYLLLFGKIVMQISPSTHDEFFANDYHYRVEQIKKSGKVCLLLLQKWVLTQCFMAREAPINPKNVSDMCK